MRTGRDTQPVEVASGMINNSLAINDMQCAVRTGLDALTGAAALCHIDHDPHDYSLKKHRINLPQPNRPSNRLFF